MREDIIRGLKNAIERGESLEKAMQSFVNAGYNFIEVKQAAQSMLGATQIISPSAEAPKMPNKPVISSQQQAQQNMPLRQVPPSLPSLPTKKLIEFQPMRQISQPRGGNNGFIIALIIVLILLLAGLIVMLLYGQELLDAILGAQ